MSNFANRITSSLRRRSSLFAGFYNYTVYVQTGDQPRAGTDAHVYIILHGQDGGKSPETKLAVLFRDDFDRGHLDKFKIKYQPVSSTNITRMKIWIAKAYIFRFYCLKLFMGWSEVYRERQTFPVFNDILTHNTNVKSSVNKLYL